jgi:hypothetical protein
MHATVGHPLLGSGLVNKPLNNIETVFSAWFLPRGYKGTKKAI